MRPVDRQKMKRLIELMQREADGMLADTERRELESLQEWRVEQRAVAPI